MRGRVSAGSYLHHSKASIVAETIKLYMHLDPPVFLFSDLHKGLI